MPTTASRPSRFRRPAMLASAVLAVALLPKLATAVVTSTWAVETFGQFDQGSSVDAYVTSLGEVRPGWQTSRMALTGDGVWSALRLSNGDILLGGDDKGAITKVTGKSSKTLAPIEGAIAVVALAQTSDGSIYAGAMPSDKLWKLDPGGGKHTAAATLKDVETIWSLAAAEDGTVYAGTGPSGKLFAIKGGSAKEIFATDDKRVTAVAIANDGSVWFGTSERALVFRYDPKSKTTRAMGDFAGNEIDAIAASPNATAGGGVIVAANDIADPPPSAPKTAAQVDAAEKPNAAKGQTTKAPDIGSKPGADKDTPAAVDTGRKGARKGKGALFRITDDGRLTQLHALTQTYFTSLIVTPDGTVYAGAADKGRIYQVEPDGTVATAVGVEERSVSHLLLDKNNLVFSTDDAAALYRVTGHASKANYVSDIFDAKAVARFGHLAWQSDGTITIETRSGNTAHPGAGWSEWQSVSDVSHSASGGPTGISGMIRSPLGRYFQFRAQLGSDSARLRRVLAYYVPQNTATAIDEVTVEVANKESNPTLKDSASKTRSPLLKIKWKIDNSDGDDTSYLVDVRRDGEANWRSIVGPKSPYALTFWDWNTETFPDGWYRVRVTSSDAQSNSPDRALTAMRMSTLVAVDNTRPTIEGLTVNYPKAQAKASDALSVITEMSFSIDDGPWQLGAAADGIFDDQIEALRIELPAELSRGSHTLAIRVADAGGNIGSTSTTFVVK